MTTESDIMHLADTCAHSYIAGIERQRVSPSPQDLALLDEFDEALPQVGCDSAAVIELLHRVGSPNTVVSNGPNYYGFVRGAALPVAAAADRLALAWDQCASSPDSAPAASRLESIAGRWLLEILDLPRESAVGFGTSATACAMTCLTAARR